MGRAAADFNWCKQMKNQSGRVRGITGEIINEELKEHAVGVDDWQYQEHIQLLYEWKERFNQVFDLGLHTPAIRLERTSVRRLGSYRHGRNGFGLLHEITLNTRYLDRPLADQLVTLLHELLHEWQVLYGKTGRGNYHNRQFRWKARLYGLLVDAHGRHLGVEPGRFTILLAQYGVDMATLRIAEEESSLAAQRLRGDSKLRKWSCGCTNLRCAVELVARCLKCGNNFQEASSLW
jgi:hypothetical protein